MKTVFIKIEGWDRSIQKEAVSTEFMNLGKGILHIITKDREYYYPLDKVESFCVVRDDY